MPDRGYKVRTKNIVFIGIGGYGVITASDICAHAAVYSGFDVKQSAIKGIAQRGGHVISYIRFGSRVFSPRVEEGKEDFVVKIGTKERYPCPKNSIVIELSEEEASRYGRDMNIYALGVFSRHLPFTEPSWFRAIRERFGINSERYIRIFLEGRFRL